MSDQRTNSRAKFCPAHALGPRLKGTKRGAPVLGWMLGEWPVSQRCGSNCTQQAVHAPSAPQWMFLHPVWKISLDQAQHQTCA